MRVLAPFVTLLLLATAGGCPMRPNPDYEGLRPSDGQVDSAACGPGEQLCSGECVSPLDPSNCGACDRECAVAPGCECAGEPPVCSHRGGRLCYATCSPGSLLCDGACVPQPDDQSCGACGVSCDGASGCRCRMVEGGGAACFRPDGDSWEEC